jgi:hypothetical protein
MNFDMDKVIILLDDSPRVNSSMYLSQLVSIGIYNFTRSVDAMPLLINNPNQSKHVASYQSVNVNSATFTDTAKESVPVRLAQRIIRFKNVTEHAGATTLIYMLKREQQ